MASVCLPADCYNSMSTWNLVDPNKEVVNIPTLFARRGDLQNLNLPVSNFNILEQTNYLRTEACLTELYFGSYLMILHKRVVVLRPNRDKSKRIPCFLSMDIYSLL